jgi:Cu/Ag efflux protein CusF
MPDTIALRTTLTQFDGLHKATDKVRSTSKTVTVDKDALANLLMDHPTMVRALLERSVQLKTDEGLLTRI